MAVENTDGNILDPSYNNAQGVNTPINLITSVNAAGVQSIVYQRTVVVNQDGTASYDQTGTVTTGGGNQATADRIISNLPATGDRPLGEAFTQVQTYRTRAVTLASSTVVSFICNRDSFPTGTGVVGTCTIPIATGVESPASGTAQDILETYTLTTSTSQSGAFDTSGDLERDISAVGTGAATPVDGTASYGDVVETTEGGITTDQTEVIVSRSPLASERPAGVTFQQTVRFRIPTITSAEFEDDTFTCEEDDEPSGGSTTRGTCTVPTGSTSPAAGTVQAIDAFYVIRTLVASPSSSDGTVVSRFETATGTAVTPTFTFAIEGPSTGFGLYEIDDDTIGGTATGAISNYRWSVDGQVSPSSGSGETFTTSSGPNGLKTITLTAEREGVDGSDSATTFIF